MTDSVTSDASHFELAFRVIDAVVPGYRLVSVILARAEFTNSVQVLYALSAVAWFPTKMHAYLGCALLRASDSYRKRGV